MKIVADNPERTLIVFHQWRFLGGAHRALLRDKRARYAEFFIQIVRSGVDQGVFNPGLDPKVAVLTILGALNWTPEWFSPSGRATAAEVADKIADSLLGGILTHRPSTVDATGTA